MGAITKYQTTCLLIAIFDNCLADEIKNKHAKFLQLSLGVAKITKLLILGAVTFYQTTCLLIALFDHFLADGTKNKHVKFSQLSMGSPKWQTKYSS